MVTCFLYRWSRADSMFALTNSKGLMIGGGGTPAIWVDGDFNHGSSGKSKTFNSRCLASTESFKCIHLEVWGTIEDVQVYKDTA